MGLYAHCHNRFTVNQKILEVALTSARAGGALLKEYFRSVPLEARVKTENDFVTKADRESEKVVLAEIRSRFPDHRILAEEAGWTGGDSDEYSWVIDPLDGTTNFLQGLPIYGVSVACQRGKNTVVAVVFDPEGENLFQAVRGEGAYWNGEPMKVSPLDGLKGAFLATGYPFRAKAAFASSQ